MKVIILASLTSGTGNNTTASRIGSFFATLDSTDVELQDTNGFHTKEEFLQFDGRQPFPRFYIGIHAYRAGMFLQHCQACPYVLIFGGTDINEHVHEPDKLAVMKVACHHAVKLIAFCESVKELAIQWLGEEKHKLQIIPPSIPEPNRADALRAVENARAIATFPYGLQDIESLNTNFNCGSPQFSIRRLLGISDTQKVLLLPCGIRPVKEPAYLLECFPWVWEESNVVFIIIGPVLDRTCYDEFQEKIRQFHTKYPGIFYVPSVRQEYLFSAIVESDALVNCSRSEGLSNALLEAMYLKVPVLARNIPGNRAVIQHERTGLLFDSPCEFKLLAERLFSCESLRNSLVANAYQFVKENHSVSHESALYVQLFHQFTTPL